MLQHSEIVQAIVDAVTEIQVASGRAPHDLGAGTTLFGGVEGFDSLNGLEMIVKLGAILGANIPDSILERHPDGESPTIGDVADRVVNNTGEHHV